MKDRQATDSSPCRTCQASLRMTEVIEEKEPSLLSPPPVRHSERGLCESMRVSEESEDAQTLIKVHQWLPFSQTRPYPLRVTEPLGTLMLRRNKEIRGGIAIHEPKNKFVMLRGYIKTYMAPRG